MWWQRLKGWRTVIFSGFLVALGIVLSGLSALDVVQLQVILPASLKPFAPMILAMVGAAVMYLRIITTTPVGCHDHDHDHDDRHGGQ